MKKPFKLLFVCLGNICRSPAAEGVMRRLVTERGLESVIEIDSAGTYGGHAGDLPDRRMRVHARQRGYELTHRSRRVTGADLERFDLIVGMDSSNVSDLRSMAATLDEVEKIVPMGRFIRRFPHYDHVPDPYYEGSEGFELVLDLLEDSCEALLDFIMTNKTHYQS
ncbi:MAG: low molecular weight phosphotyrosine protein phosphatase [Bacteroidales bacterium]|nr:low molecular weight phosphotyrosine protein phosphatase [Bacteroidales bacterium]